jgi:hypothetical protein
VQVKTYQRQFEEEAYQLASQGLLEKILELNELLHSRKLDLSYAPKADANALKDCPDNVVELMVVVEELYTDAADTLRKIRTWLCLKTIEVGVTKENGPCSVCAEFRLGARLGHQRRHTGRRQLLDSAEEEHRTVPFRTRRTRRQIHDVSAGAQVHAHACILLQLDDYKMSMAYLDRMHFIELRDNIVLLRDRYVLTYDMLDKFAIRPTYKRRSVGV